jgi:hypothetical protein
VSARPPRRLAAALLAAAAVGGPWRARADALPVTLSVQAGHVHAAADLAPRLPPALTDELSNGLRNVLAVFVAVVPAGAEEPTIGTGRVIEVLFDVWEEAWTVTVRDPQKPGGHRSLVRSADELRRLLGHAADVDLGPPEGLPAGRFALEVRIDVNPVSPELLARTREFLAGASGPGRASRSVLGAVAGFLLREPSDEGEVLSFRSAPLRAEATGGR